MRDTCVVANENGLGASHIFHFIIMWLFIWWYLEL